MKHLQQSKKLFKIVFSLILLLYGAGLFANSFSYLENFSYAYYLDNRNENPFYRGYVVFHDDNGETTTIFSHFVNLTTNEESTYTFTLGDNDGNVAILRTSGVEGLSPEAQQNIPDFINYHMMYKFCETEISTDTVKEDPWPGYSQYYHFNKYLPMFHFSKITNSVRPFSQLTLDRSGNIHNLLPSDDEEGLIQALETFKAMKPLVCNYDEKTYPISKAKKMPVKIGNKKITLDKNWEPYESPEEGLSGYKISKYSIRDAQITIEDLSPFLATLGDMPVEEYQEKFMKILLSGTEIIDYSTVEVKEKNGSLCAGMHFVGDDGVMNYRYFEISKDTILNFSAFSVIYLNNEDYFEGIFNSVK